MLILSVAITANVLRTTKERTATKVGYSDTPHCNIFSSRKHTVKSCSVKESGRVLFFVLTDVNECLVRNPCKNGGICQNTRGGYQCTCAGRWFSGKNCDQGRLLRYLVPFPNDLTIQLASLLKI